MLAMACRQLPEDWETTHGYRPVLLETFVDISRYKRTCYHAANWIKIGHTTGRHVDKHGEKKTIKEIYIYPLSRHCQPILTHGHSPSNRSKKTTPKGISYGTDDPFVRV